MIPTTKQRGPLKKKLNISNGRSDTRRASRSQVQSVPSDTITVDSSCADGSREVLKAALKELGWKEVPSSRSGQHCDIHWHTFNFEQRPDIAGGKINKFPGMSWICSKMNLFQVLDAMKELFPNDFDFYPKTWYLPREYHKFTLYVHYVNRSLKKRHAFIVKPDGGSQGEGIYLIQDPQQYVNILGKDFVVQEYLSNVYLIDNLKFDLRVYVVLASIDPPEVYICKEGLGRFCTIPYEGPTDDNIGEMYMHLTNFSLNKRSKTYDHSDNEAEGTKRTLSSILALIGKAGHDPDLVWRRIEDLVCKTVISIIPDLKLQHIVTIPYLQSGPACFQILGFDILLLEDLRPMLLEVNGAPSLSIGSTHVLSPDRKKWVENPKDVAVKVLLVTDTLRLVAPHVKLLELERKRRHEKKRRNRTRRELFLRQHEQQKLKENTTDLSSRGRRTRSASKHIKDLYQNYNKELEMEDDKALHDQRCKTREDNDENAGVIINGSFFKDEIDDEKEVMYSENKNKKEENVVKIAGEKCLKRLYPGPDGFKFDQIRIYDRFVDIFVSCLGLRSTQRLSQSDFRAFGRRCHLEGKGISNASQDTLYIKMLRKWEHANTERITGLCFRGFLDACEEIAGRIFYTSSKVGILQNFMEYCEISQRSKKGSSSSRRATLPKIEIRPFRQMDRPYLQAGNLKLKFPLLI